MEISRKTVYPTRSIFQNHGPLKQTFGKNQSPPPRIFNPSASTYVPNTFCNLIIKVWSTRSASSFIFHFSFFLFFISCFYFFIFYFMCALERSILRLRLKKKFWQKCFKVFPTCFVNIFLAPLTLFYSVLLKFEKLFVNVCRGWVGVGHFFVEITKSEIGRFIEKKEMSKIQVSQLIQGTIEIWINY